jgi:hypothetical protein
MITTLTGHQIHHCLSDVRVARVEISGDSTLKVAPHAAEGSTPRHVALASENPNSQNGRNPHHNEDDKQLAEKLREPSRGPRVVTHLELLQDLLEENKLYDHSENENERDTGESGNVNDPEKDHGNIIIISRKARDTCDGHALDGNSINQNPCANETSP